MQALSVLGRIRAECRMHGDDLSEQEMRVRRRKDGYTYGSERRDAARLLALVWRDDVWMKYAMEEAVASSRAEEDAIV